ncbi:MAG: ABC transporter ATP-binding protein [Candidatus Cyclobacteriaceae bacterium M2_1C_046]
MSNNNENCPIIVKGIYKSFGDLHILKGVDLCLNEKENFVILGRSGSGKSVFIKCIVGLLEPDKGEIEILGKKVHELELKKLHDLRTRIGFLFQHGALYDSLNIEDNLRFPLEKTTNLSKGEIKDRIDDALESVGLPETRKKMPNDLSGGMQKRIALARSFIQNPQVMLYDEPTAGLDTVTSREISELILELQEKHDMSSIIISHDMASAKIVANRMAVLHEGQLEEKGTYDELKNSTKDHIKAFFG